jgi:hypothetical protein
MIFLLGPNIVATTVCKLSKWALLGSTTNRDVAVQITLVASNGDVYGILLNR